MAELAEVVGKTARTVREHLRVLERDGLAVQIEGRWFRLRFDPEAVMEDLGVRDLLPRRQAEHLRQRRAYWDACADGRLRSKASVTKELVGGHWYYLDQNTQEIVWRDPVAAGQAQDETG